MCMSMRSYVFSLAPPSPLAASSSAPDAEARRWPASGGEITSRGNESCIQSCSPTLELFLVLVDLSSITFNVNAFAGRNRRFFFFS